MGRARVAAGVAAAAAGAAVLARAKRGTGERVEIRYDDGSAVTLDQASPQRDALLAAARRAIEAARS